MEIMKLINLKAMLFNTCCKLNADEDNLFF
jgi:hypothetical protein